MNTPIARIVALLSPPAFADEEQTRLAGIVYVMMIGLSLVSLLAMIVDRQFHTIVILFVANVLGLVAHGANRRGHARGAGFALLLIFLIALTALLLAGNGVHDIAITGLPALLIVSALILSRRGLIAITMLSIASVGLVVYAGVVGLPGRPVEARLAAEPGDFLIVAAIVGVAAFASHILIEQLVDGLKRSRLSEARMRSIVTNTPDYIMEIDRAGAITFINKRPERYLGRNIRELLPPDQHQRAMALIESAFTTGQPQLVELETIMPDEPMRWASYRFGPITAGGRITGLTVIMTDITAQKSAETALRESEARISRALVAGGVVPYLIDYRLKRFTFIGENVALLTGYPAEEITPQSLRNSIVEEYMWGPNAGLSADEARERVRAGEALEWRSDMRIRTATGELRWVSDIAVEIVDAAGKAIGGIGILQDITERKQAEAKVQQSAAENARLSAHLQQELAERIHAETALKEREEQYRAFISLSADAIFHAVFDPPIAIDLPEEVQLAQFIKAGRIVECNQVFATLYGSQKKLFIPKVLWA